jgi:hypothetical protein
MGTGPWFFVVAFINPAAGADGRCFCAVIALFFCRAYKSAGMWLPKAAAPHGIVSFI